MINIHDHLALEEAAVILGTPIIRLMENAGKAVAHELEKRFDLKKKSLVFVCSHGNNGGDGFAAALYLKQYNPKVSFIGNQEKLGDESRYYFEQLDKAAFVDDFSEFDIIVDCMLGTGFSGDLREPILSAVKKINRVKGFVVSIDVPTGVSADSGKKAQGYVKCDLLLSVKDLKSGLKEFEKVNQNMDIGFPGINMQKVQKGIVPKVVASRKTGAHKGDFGRVLVIGGSKDYSGAPILASMAVAALRCGTDLVTLAAPAEIAAAARKLCPDIITKPLEGDVLEKKHIKVIAELIEKSDVLLIGPGLGMNPKTKAAVSDLLKINKPKVVDADAIKLADLKSVKNTIFTPHRKEFEALLENSKINRKDLLESLGSNVILLKGKNDFVFSKSKTVYYNSTGNPAMTVGGTGDVLAGVSAGFLAQAHDYSNQSMINSACAAAFVLGLIGDQLERELGGGLIASDFLRVIASTVKRLT